MLKFSAVNLATTLAIVTTFGAMQPAGAAVTPVASGLTLQTAAAPLETVAFRGGDRIIPRGGVRGGARGGFAQGFSRGGFARGPQLGGEQRFARHRGPSIAPFVGGLGVGLLAGTLGNPYGQDYGPGYYDDAAPQPFGADVAYCLQRFKSYDPALGSYLGYDGFRHPCP